MAQLGRNSWATTQPSPVVERKRKKKRVVSGISHMCYLHTAAAESTVQLISSQPPLLHQLCTYIRVSAIQNFKLELRINDWIAD